MLIAVSCLHFPDATISMTSVNHIYEQHMRIIIYLRSLISPLLFAVERPLPFINCFWSVLILTDPDQLGVTGFVKIYAFWEFLTDTYGTQTAMVQARQLCNLTRTFALNGLTYRRMAENGFAPPPPPREFCRHILSCRELKAESFKRCLHSVLRGVSL